MKLRLRCHETRETLKCELPDTSTLHHLRCKINSSSPSSVHLSLNRKDELLAPSPEDSLRTLGLTSGDLVYYSFSSSAFKAEVASSMEGQHNPVRDRGDSTGKSGEQETLVQEWKTNPAIRSCSNGTVSGDLGSVRETLDVSMNDQNQATADLNFDGKEQIEEKTQAISGREVLEPMDVDFKGVEMADAKRLSEPFFLKKVLLEECTDTSEPMVLVMALHAVMLESGFSLFDPCSGVVVKKFSLSKEKMHAVSLNYSLPELVTRKDSMINECVGLKFQRLGHMLIVYGSLIGTSAMHRVHLDSRRFVPAIDLVMDTLKSDKEASSKMYREVFEFWRIVKDGIALPLLLDICYKTGLELPPCLMRLPTELKLKILESLPGVDIARVACVCSEMRYVASNNELWKRKCLQEFGNLVNEGENVGKWKGKFGALWGRQRRQNNVVVRRMRPHFGGFPHILGDPYPSEVGFPAAPWYDRDRDRDHHPSRLPGGLPFRFQMGQRGPGTTGFGRLRGRNLSPRCNLGGIN